MDPENCILNIVCLADRRQRQAMANELRAWYAQGGYHPTIHSVLEEAYKCGHENKIFMCRLGYLRDLGVRVK